VRRAPSALASPAAATTAGQNNPTDTPSHGADGARSSLCLLGAGRVVAFFATPAPRNQLCCPTNWKKAHSASAMGAVSTQPAAPCTACKLCPLRLDAVAHPAKPFASSAAAGVNVNRSAAKTFHDCRCHKELTVRSPRTASGPSMQVSAVGHSSSVTHLSHNTTPRTILPSHAPFYGGGAASGGEHAEGKLPGGLGQPKLPPAPLQLRPSQPAHAGRRPGEARPISLTCGVAA
jgi:hypothetical protein